MFVDQFSCHEMKYRLISFFSFFFEESKDKMHGISQSLTNKIEC